MALKMSMEELQDEVMDSDETAEESNDVKEYDEDETQINDDVAEADMYEDANKQLVEVSEGLEAIRDQISQYLEEGGMNRQTAAMAQLAIQNTKRGWVAETRMPSMESFDEAGGRVTATGYALEAFDFNLGEIWKKIVLFVTKWVGKIVEIWQRMFGSAKSLVNRAESLKKKFTELKTDAAHDKGKIKLNVNQVRNLCTDSATVSKTTIETGLTNMATDLSRFGDKEKVKTLFDPIITTYKTIADDLEKEGKVSDAKIGAKTIYNKDLLKASSIEDIVKNTFGTANITKNGFKLVSNKNKTYFAGKHLYLGGKLFVIEINQNDDGVFKNLKVGLINKVSSETFKEPSYEINSLSSADAEGILDKVVEVGNALVKMKNDSSERKTIINDLKKESDKVVNALKKADYEQGDKSANKTLRNLATGYVHAFTSISTSVFQPEAGLKLQTLMSGIAAYSYCAKSYSDFKKEKKD